MFGHKLVVVRIAMRVEKAQPREMTFETQLFRRRGKEEQGRGRPGQVLHHEVRIAGSGGRPAKVMRLVDDQQVPARRGRLPQPFGVSDQESHPT